MTSRFPRRTTFDVIIAISYRELVIDEVVLYPGLFSFKTAEALVESCNTNPHAEFIAAEMRRLHPNALVTTRVRINN